MDIASALQQAKHDINNIDADVLLAHVLGKDRSYLRAWPEQKIDSAALTHFQQLVRRRTTGEPLAYLTGWREFWSLQLQVSPATLIPRPETELLVDHALKKIPVDANWRIADLGTGSGAIALALASERPHCQFIATDISPTALAIARSNAERLNISNVEFRQGDWREALGEHERFQLIATNPPYIDADDQHLHHDGLPFEPQIALTPGQDGLTAIRNIITQMATHLCHPGWLILEHGYQQALAIHTLLQQHGYNDVITHRDLSDNERISLAKQQA